MAKKSASFDKVEFLLTCIKQGSGEVKIDFDKVAAELSTTKGAAAKRYSRIIKGEAQGDLEFLKVCVRVSSIKLDYGKIASHLGIQKNACSKRFYRIMAAVSTPAPAESDAGTPTDATTKGAKGRKATGTKRKGAPDSGSEAGEAVEPKKEGGAESGSEAGQAVEPKKEGGAVAAKKRKTAKAETESGGDKDEGAGL